MLLATLALGLCSSAPTGDVPVVLSMRERAALRDRLVAERLEHLAPELMRREAIDMWILVSREYNEDPVFHTMAPSTWMAARRRTILVLHDPGEDAPLERLAVSRYAVGELFEGAWNKEEEPDQWAALARLVEERDPQRIGIDFSTTFALADGISSTELAALHGALPDTYRERLVSAEKLAIAWLETRSPGELEVYPTICRIAHRIIAEGLSDAVIQPGHTTTDDVAWWYRERIRELRLSTWFHPSVSVQRNEGAGHSGSFASDEGSRTIRRGDLIHIDFGITYLGLNTDTQQHAYVLRAGEREAPLGLQRGLAAANRLQDLLVSRFRVGATGNEVLRSTREAAIAEGLNPTIYTHPLGFHGHGAGSTIGLWDQQGGVPGRGDHRLTAPTVWSIELNAAAPVPEWGDQEVRFMLEEDAVFDGEEVRWLDGRQVELILIP